MRNPKVRNVALWGVIAALYTVISMVLAPIGFGSVQARIAEALTLLPVLGPLSIPGITLGCALTNAIGVAAGMDILGPIDIPLGAMATLIAAILTYLVRNVRFKGIPWLAPLPPVLVNAIIIGGEFSFAMTGGFTWPAFFVNALSIGLGQFVSCYVLGLILIYFMEKAGMQRYFSNH